MIEWLLAAIALVITLVAIAVLLVRAALRRAWRRVGGGESRLLQLRGAVLPPGPRRDAVRLRSRLRAELAATRDMLERAPQGLIFRADAAAVLADVTATAAELDGELREIERFLDPAQQRQALTTVSGQVEQLVAATYSARQTILRTAGQDRARQLAALRDEVAAQEAAADNYRRNGSSLNL